MQVFTLAEHGYIFMMLTASGLFRRTVLYASWNVYKLLLNHSKTVESLCNTDAVL